MFMLVTSFPKKSRFLCEFKPKPGHKEEFYELLMWFGHEIVLKNK